MALFRRQVIVAAAIAERLERNRELGPCLGDIPLRCKRGNRLEPEPCHKVALEPLSRFFIQPMAGRRAFETGTFLHPRKQAHLHGLLPAAEESPALSMLMHLERAAGIVAVGKPSELLEDLCQAGGNRARKL